jgi:hypothetical protein
MTRLTAAFGLAASGLLAAPAAGFYFPNWPGARTPPPPSLVPPDVPPGTGNPPSVSPPVSELPPGVDVPPDRDQPSTAPEPVAVVTVGTGLAALGLARLAKRRR